MQNKQRFEIKKSLKEKIEGISKKKAKLTKDFSNTAELHNFLASHPEIKQYEVSHKSISEEDSFTEDKESIAATFENIRASQEKNSRQSKRSHTVGGMMKIDEGKELLSDVGFINRLKKDLKSPRKKDNWLDETPITGKKTKLRSETPE